MDELTTTSIEKCETCLRLLPTAESHPKTQWISFCRCEFTYSPNAQFSIDWCSNCKKRVATNNVGKVNHPDLCSCENPNPLTVPAVPKQSESDEALQLDLASIGMSNEDFPLERFKPIGILGHRAKADVVLCRDKQTGKKVAVKCFKGIKPDRFSAFEQEAKKNTRLSHTNIAKVIHVGVHENKTPYIVTDYKDGFDLEQYLAIYGIPSHDVAVKILVSVCEALVYAQKESLHHRCIKPGNIIFLDDGNSEPSISLTDFSPAKLKLEEDLLSPADAHYMSSDVARNLDFDERSELYSIGCVGYSLLTGKTPFEAETAQELKNNHALKLQTRISTVRFEADRPKDLEEVIERCLEKDPRERFESVAKLLERLEVFPRREKMRIDALNAAKASQRNKLVLMIGAVLFALCVVAYFVLKGH